jgi:hypothetical protein
VPKDDDGGVETTSEWVERLIAAAEAGEALDLAPRAVSDALPLSEDEVAVWGDEHTIRAADLRQALLALAHREVDPRGLTVKHARIVGDVNLDYCALSFPLRFNRSVFTGELSLRASRLAALALTGCRCTAFSVELIEVRGNVDLTNLTAIGAVRAIGARITGQLALTGASLTNLDGHALSLDGAQIDGGAFLKNLTATGAVRLPGARITGQLALTGANLTNPSGDALSLDGAHIDGGAVLDDLTATGAVRAPGARITGQLALTGANLTNPSGDALALDGAQIDSGAFLDGLTAAGAVRALGARITGQLALVGANLTNPKGDALALDRAQIDSGAVLDDLTATGAVRAPGARITGQLALTGANLTNPDGNALSLDGAQIDGGAFLRNLTATGAVRALGARITGQLALTGANLTNPKGDALSLDRAQIDGGAVLDDLTATGAVRALGARITGQLRFRGAKLTNPKGHALDLDGAQIDGLFLGTDSGGRMSGGLSLAQAHIGVLSAHGTLAAPLFAAGWKLGDVHGVIRESGRTARVWLDSDTGTFSSQAWHELAALFDRVGQPTEARRLRFEAARRTTRHAPWYAKPLRWAYGVTVGHGYYPLRAAGWLAAIFFAALLLTSNVPQVFGPADLSAAVPASVLNAAPRDELPTGADSCEELEPGYPCFAPVQLAVSVAVPVVDTVQASAWQPVGAAALTVVGVLRVAAWVLTALLLAGVTGLLRRT